MYATAGDTSMRSAQHKAVIKTSENNFQIHLLDKMVGMLFL